MEHALDKIIEHSVTGALLVVALYVIFRQNNALDRERRRTTTALEEVQKERLEDAKAHNLQLIELTKAAVSAIGNSTNAAVATKEAIGEVKVTIREQTEAMKDSAEEFRRLAWRTK